MRRVDGVKVTRLTPGDLLICRGGQQPSRGGARGGQKSATAIVAAAHGGEGPDTRSGSDAMRSMDERPAESSTDRSSPARRVSGGTAESRGRGREADTARGEHVAEGVRGFMEEVEIPKPGRRGTRVLGIPTVLDRMIQQAHRRIRTRTYGGVGGRGRQRPYLPDAYRYCGLCLQPLDVQAPVGVGLIVSRPGLEQVNDRLLDL